MTSLCTQYYQFFLAQAILLGISTSFVTWPAAAVVSRTLPTHRGLALGLVIGGSSIGGIVWPIVLEQLLNKTNLGFGWTMRIAGFIMVPFMALACVAVVEAPQLTRVAQPASVETVGSDQEAQNSEKPQQREKTDFTILKNKVFLLLCLGLAIGYLGLFVPLIYIPSYATDMGISASMSFYLISVVNGASFFGRVIPGMMADKYGHYNFMVVALGASALVGFCMTTATGLAGLIVWGMAYGFTSGVSGHRFGVKKDKEVHP